MEPEAQPLPFTDVAEGDWYYEAVQEVYAQGLLRGITADEFAPHLSLTRCMAVTVLYRLAGEPEPDRANPFEDVKDGFYYEKAVRWAYGRGIVAGRTAISFEPDTPITRQELATFLYRYSEGFFERDTLTDFGDGGEASLYARPALCWAVECGIVSGRGNGILDPLGPATRAETATMLKRFWSLAP